MKTFKYENKAKKRDNTVKGTDMISTNRAFAKTAKPDQLKAIADFIGKYPEYADLADGLFEDK